MAQKKAAELEDRLNTLETQVEVLRKNQEDRFSLVDIKISDVERKVDEGIARLEGLILSLAKPTQPGPTESTNMEERAPASLPLNTGRGKGVIIEEASLGEGNEARPAVDLTQPSQGDKSLPTNSRPVGAALAPTQALANYEIQQQGRGRPSPTAFQNFRGPNQHMFYESYEHGEPSIHDFHQDVRFQEGRNIRNFQPDYGAAPTRGLGAPYGNNQPRPPARDFDTRIRKLDMPIFEGLNAEDWIYKAERYFWVNNIRTDAEKIGAAALCLEGRALSWFQYREERGPIYFWAEFRESLLERFKGQQANEVHERFFALTQEASVEDYRDRFEALASRLVGISDVALLGNFMKGLKPTIRTAVRVHNPRGLDEAMKLAQLIEEQARTERPRLTMGNSHRHNSAIKQESESNLQEPPRASTNNFGQQQGFKRMSESDIQAKRAKGLCYRCEERWAPGHRCHPKALQVIIVHEDEDDPEDHLGPEAYHESQMDGIALNSISGLTPSHAMTLRGWIGDRETIVMIDSGATHNFISQQLAKEEGIPIIDKGQFEVTLATGEVKESRGYCPNVELDLPRYKVTSDFLPLNIKGADIILGVQWLQTLGDVKTNWQSLQMEFHDAGKKIQLYGEPELTMGKAIMAQSIWATSFKHNPIKGLPPEASRGIQEKATLESFEEFHKLFPEFNLEDKVVFKGGGIDRTSKSPNQIQPTASIPQEIQGSKAPSLDFAKPGQRMGTYGSGNIQGTWGTLRPSQARAKLGMGTSMEWLENGSSNQQVARGIVGHGLSTTRHGRGTFEDCLKSGQGTAEPTRASWLIIGQGQARDIIPYAWDQGARAINAQDLQGHFIEGSYADLAKDEFDHYHLGQHWIPSLKEAHKEQQRPP